MNRASTLGGVLVAALVGCMAEDPSTSDIDQRASVHLKGGAHAEPSFTDLGLALRSTGALSGLGFEDVNIELVAQVNVDARCGNPGSNTWQAPGQNPAPITVSGSQAIPADELKNGNTPFDVSTLAPPSIVAGAPDCPNEGWTEVIVDLAFLSSTMTVEQPDGVLKLTVACSLSPPPTSNGPVPASQVSCTSF